MNKTDYKRLADVAGYNESTMADVYNMGFCVRPSIYDEWKEWRPELNEEHTLRLLEGLKHRGLRLSIHSHCSSGGWLVMVDGKVNDHSSCHAFQVAICDAALKAIVAQEAENAPR